MIEPELWGKNNDITTITNIEYLHKYKNFIKWGKNESIFEFGMGDGRNTREALMPLIPEDFKEYIGSDKSKTMVDHVKKNILNPKFRFIEFDISSEVIPDGFENRFDHIFGFFVMHWVPKTRQAFGNMYKMLKPGGQLFLTFADEISPDPIYLEFTKHPKWSKYDHKWLISPYFNHLDPQKEYKEHLVASGFNEFKYETTDKMYTFPNEESFIGFCLSVNPVLKQVSNEDYEEYKKEYIEKMANNKLNYTSVCPKTGKTLYHSGYHLNVVLTQKQ